MRKKEISFIALCIIGFLLSTNLTEVLAWSNGGYSSDPSNPDYGTHDWIAQHALDWLPISEKQYVLDNLAIYLYGTELPDNSQAPDGIGDSINHHFYYSSAGTVVDDSAADRASAVYTQALNFMMSGDSVNAAKYAGIMSHYIVDLAVFGHVMGSGTDWGAEAHHSDYESYVNHRTSTYLAEFNAYLSFDENLRIISAYDAARELAYDTTFDVNGHLTCIWMDQNYDWSNPTFRNRCGESLNLAVNYLTDVLHTLYIQNEFAFFTIALEVKDSSGSPIAGAQVLAFSEDWGIRIPGTLEPSTFLDTDSAGRAIFQVSKGMWTFFAFRGEPGSCFFLIASIQVQSSTTVVLKPSATFSVSVFSIAGSLIDIDEFRIVDESHAPILPTASCGTTLAGRISVAVNSQGPFRVLAVRKPFSSEGYCLMATNVNPSQNLEIRPTSSSTSSVTFRAFAADNSPTMGNIEVRLPFFDINNMVVDFSFTNAATVIFTPMPVMFNFRFLPSGWYLYFSSEAHELAAGSSFEVKFGGPLTKQLQVIPHASTGQGGSPSFAPKTQIWLKIADQFGHILLFMSTPSGMPAFPFTLTQGGNTIYQNTIPQGDPFVLSISEEYSDSSPPTYQLDGNLGPFGIFSLSGPLISLETTYQIDTSPSAYFKMAIPIGFGARTERNEAFMDRLYEVAQDMTGQAIYGDIQYEVDIQGGGFSWETLPAPTKVLLVVQIGMDPLYAPSLFFAAHEFGHTRTLRDPTNIAMDFWGESYSTLIAIEGISRIIGQKMWLWETGHHDFFFYHLQGRSVSDRSQQIETSQFVLAYLQKKFGWGIHHDFFYRWSTELASKAHTLQFNGFGSSEIYATLYSFWVGQNLAWIFDLAGLGVTEARVAEGLALISPFFHVGSILYLHSKRSAEWSGTLDYNAPTLSTGEPVEAELPEYYGAYLFGIQTDFDTTIPAGLYIFKLWIKADNDQRVVISLGCRSETMSINFGGRQYDVNKNTEITEYSFDYRLQDAYEIYEGEWFYTQISLGTGLTLYIDHQSTPSSIITRTLSLFHPHAEFWFTWYDKLDTEICNIHFVNTGMSVATVTVSIAVNPVDSFTLGAGLSTHRNYNVNNGPVHIISDQPLWVTKRVVGWGGFKEVYGLPGDVASTDIYYTWYDYASPGVTSDKIYLTNPSASSTATAQIYIGGSFMKSVTLSPGESKYETFLGVINGPVRILSDVPIFSTQLVIGWDDFDEIVGTPSWYVASEHYFTWYDSVGASIDNIHIINPSASTAQINIYIAGLLKTSSPISLPSGEQTYVNYPSVIGGPVRIVSDQPIRVTQRIVGWNGFKEVFSVPAELMTSTYYFTWYDWASPPVTWDALHFMNPSATQTAHITVRIGGNVMTTLTLAPGQADYATYQGTINGPILITSDIPIMTTQRILGWSSFEETIGMQWT